VFDGESGHDDEKPFVRETFEQTTATETQARATTGLRTAAEMLAKQTIPLTAYREGALVRHPNYGEGVIVDVSGRGPKRIARVRFDDGEHSFRLAFVDLQLVAD
jgi:DNA helicase-2/ATP-dependent DNA helicase PcrA